MSDREMSTLLEISEGRLAEIIRLEADNARLRERVAGLETKLEKFNAELCVQDGSLACNRLDAKMAGEREHLLLEALRWLLEDISEYGIQRLVEMAPDDLKEIFAPLIAEAREKKP